MSPLHRHRSLRIRMMRLRMSDQDPHNQRPRPAREGTELLRDGHLVVPSPLVQDIHQADDIGPLIPQRPQRRVHLVPRSGEVGLDVMCAEAVPVAEQLEPDVPVVDDVDAIETVRGRAVDDQPAQVVPDVAAEVDEGGVAGLEEGQDAWVGGVLADGGAKPEAEAGAGVASD